MNQLDYIDQLRNNEIKPEFILDHLACWFSADQIKEFFEDFVNTHDITFGDEDDKWKPLDGPAVDWPVPYMGAGFFAWLSHEKH